MNVAEFIPQFAKMLKNLDTWLEKATAYAKQKKFDVDVFTTARLAPDQFTLVRQVQSACDAAKFCAVYLTGKDAPVFPDNEKTVEELRARIRGCIAYLETVKPADFAGAEERKVAPPWLQGKWLRGDHYLIEVAIPNFQFHVTTAYSILRHNGVELGKQDFIGSLPVRD
jgi:hypothetical protein